MTAGTESLGSLLRRLGTPPPDLAEHLTHQFQLACTAIIDSGDSIHKVDLDDWCISDQGKLVLSVSAKSNAGSGDLGAGDLAAVDLTRLTAQFRECLAVEIEGATTRGANKMSSATQRQRAAGNPKTPKLAPVEAEDRNKLMDLFGASLADRFGSDVIEQPTGPLGQSDSVKLIPMERDQRFNWNRVLAVGVVAVVLVVALIGTRVAQDRKRRAAIAVSATNRSADEPSKIEVLPPKTLNTPESHADTSLLLTNTLRKSTLETGGREPGSEMTGRSSDSQDADLDRSFSVTEKLGVAEELASIDLESALSGADTFASAVATEEILALGLPLDVMMDFRPRNSAESGSKPPQIVGSLPDPGAPDPILDDDDEIPESPQQPRAKETQFDQLLATNVTDRAIDLAGSMARIERVEFPVSFPIEVRRQGDEMPALLVNTKSGAAIATITRNDAVNRLQWTDQASRDRISSRLIHGRLVDANNGALYLRPSIETDAFLLSFSQKDCHPTWDLGGDILPKVTQLEMGLAAPDSIDVAWIQPFNPTRLNKGTAVAVLTPKDGETIAIKVILNVKCSRKLSCVINYWARLDPTFPWQEISRLGLEGRIQRVSEMLVSGEVNREWSKRQYEQADSITQKFLRSNRTKFKNSINTLKATHERLILLRNLLDQVESSVALELRLFVNWAELQQIILDVADEETPMEPSAAP